MWKRCPPLDSARPVQAGDWGFRGRRQHLGEEPVDRPDLRTARRHLTIPHPTLCGMDYNSGWADDFAERVLRIRKECGIDGWDRGRRRAVPRSSRLQGLRNAHPVAEPAGQAVQTNSR